MSEENVHLGLNTLVRQNEDIVTANVDDEIMALSVEMGFYYGFRKSSLRIWELLEEPKTVEEVCEVLGAEYKVDEETCKRDVLEFLSQLADERLIHLVG